MSRIWDRVFAGKSAAWTAIFTAALTVFTYMLYQVSKDSTNASKEQARAIVTFGGFGLGPAFNEPSGKWAGQQFQINWSNSGTLPAKAGVFGINEKPFYDDLPDSFDFPLVEANNTQGIIPPKGLYGSTVTVPRDHLEDNWRGKARIFVWGTAVYRDGFSDDPVRVSEFCSEVYQVTVAYTSLAPGSKAPAKPPSIGEPNTTIGNISWKSCTHGAHSCYDEDCKDYADRVREYKRQQP